jgi:tetratricopeptide (TPR) repeat protein
VKAIIAFTAFLKSARLLMVQKASNQTPRVRRRRSYLGGMQERLRGCCRQSPIADLIGLKIGTIGDSDGLPDAFDHVRRSGGASWHFRHRPLLERKTARHPWAVRHENAHPATLGGFSVSVKSGEEATAMRNRRATLFVLIHLASFSGAAAAQSLDQQRCFGHDLDHSIAGCTAMIQSGQETQENLIRAFIIRGSDYSEQGQYDRAIENYKRALAADPRNAAADTGLRLAYFSQAIKNAPNWAPGIVNRGNLYAKTGQTERAFKDYDQAIKLGSYPAAWVERGNLYAKTGQTERAIGDYDEAIHLFPNYDYAFLKRGEIFRALGQQARAASDFATAKKLKSQYQRHDKSFAFLMGVGFISPIVAIILAIIFYVMHCHRVEVERRIPVLLYVPAAIISGGIGGSVGLTVGIHQACSAPKSSNLCGLWGFFVTGPICFSLAVALVGVALFLVRPGQSSIGT